jgi:IS30 family transposase
MAAAERMGLAPGTCYAWAKEAGVRGRPGRPHPGRERYDRLRRDGASRGVAAAEVGVGLRTAQDWDKGIRRSGPRRIRPDGTVSDYKRSMPAIAPAPALPSSGAAGPPPAAPARPVPLAVLEKQISPRYLSLQERERIRDLLLEGATLTEIGRRLGRPASTVSREIARNSADGHYLPYAAHHAAASRRPRPKQAKLAVPGLLRDFVQKGLATRHSPEQICHDLVRTFPQDPEMRVCPETVYQALYVQARGGLRREVEAALRTGRARRRPRTGPHERTPRFKDPMIMISERPAEIEDRAVPGHWEGDLITGARNQSAIGTLVERATRYVLLVHLPGGHTAEEVRDGLIRTVSALPAHLRGSLTWDQGTEMAAHLSFTAATDMPVYFCDPASPWQRGSNENTNGLLRQYFPKGTDLSVYGPEDLEHVAQELNGRPRKTLGWDTPAERLRDLLTSG